MDRLNYFGTSTVTGLEGKIAKFIKVREGKFIAYDEYNKVIISKNPVNEGYYKLKNVSERSTFYHCETEKVPYDYYYGMSFAEFKEVLKVNDFKIAFELPFNDEENNEVMLIAYHENTRTIITVDTYNGRKKLNSAELFCPGLDKTKFRLNKLYSRGDTDYVVFNLMIANSHYRYNPFHVIIHKCEENIKENGIAPFKRFPKTYHYIDDFTSFEEVNKRFLDKSPNIIKEWFKDVNL